MTDGLAILTAWVEFGVIVGVLLWLLLRDSGSDPREEAHRTLTDGDGPNG
ncbi:MAG: hypothetical protein QOJ92_1282 [Frankiales bacterium]|nr:hypothetical protein [Frankiales bacterium]